MSRFTANDDLLGGDGEFKDYIRGAGGRLVGQKPAKKMKDRTDYVHGNGELAPDAIQVGGLSMRLKEEEEDDRPWVVEQEKERIRQSRQRITR
jgi:hypothetical protein